ncbi:MAG: hypothetical protein II995_00410, partial [Oscillospiraceae bacterium]|nr:hypothetical protein [Oscillospiraceae bacterium]
TEKITLNNAFAAADDVLRQGVSSISDLICTTGIVNLDFADVTSIMKNAGNAHMGVGRAAGKDKARMAAEMAINSPLLETSINGAMGVLANITASPDISLDEVTEASDIISSAANPDVNLIWGVTYDENLGDEMIITVIATGFDRAGEYDIPNYINDIGNYKFKDNSPAVEVKAAAAVAPAPAPAAPASVPAAAPEAVVEQPVPAAPVVEPEEQPMPELLDDTVEEDPYDVIMRMFKGPKH